MMTMRYYSEYVIGAALLSGIHAPRSSIRERRSIHCSVALLHQRSDSLQIAQRFCQFLSAPAVPERPLRFPLGAQRGLIDQCRTHRTAADDKIINDASSSATRLVEELSEPLAVLWWLTTATRI